MPGDWRGSGGRRAGRELPQGGAENAEEKVNSRMSLRSDGQSSELSVRDSIFLIWPRGLGG